jgi:hypothetical protein
MMASSTRDCDWYFKMKEKTDPFPSSLDTVISPPLLSTNSFARIKPRPIPFSLLVPRFVKWVSGLKSLAISKALMPTPESTTQIDNDLQRLC